MIELLEKHTCEAVALHCIDFRFRKMLHEYLALRFPNGYDLISVAGGVKRLIEDPLENNFVLEQLQTSDRLHSPRTMVLIQHEDCGAYGGSKTFSDFEKEHDFHAEQLAKAESLLKKTFPDTIVEKSFIRLSGELISL